MFLKLYSFEFEDWGGEDKKTDLVHLISMFNMVEVMNEKLKTSNSEIAIDAKQFTNILLKGQIIKQYQVRSNSNLVNLLNKTIKNIYAIDAYFSIDSDIKPLETNNDDLDVIRGNIKRHITIIKAILSSSVNTNDHGMTANALLQVINNLFTDIENLDESSEFIKDIKDNFLASIELSISDLTAIAKQSKNNKYTDQVGMPNSEKEKIKNINDLLKESTLFIKQISQQYKGVKIWEKFNEIKKINKMFSFCKNNIQRLYTVENSLSSISRLCTSANSSVLKENINELLVQIRYNIDQLNQVMVNKIFMEANECYKETYFNYAFEHFKSLVQELPIKPYAKIEANKVLYSITQHMVYNSNNPSAIINAVEGIILAVYRSDHNKNNLYKAFAKYYENLRTQVGGRSYTAAA